METNDKGIPEQDFRYHPLYPLAMLRLSSEQKGAVWHGIEVIIQDTLKELEIPKVELDSYMKEHKVELLQVYNELGL